MNGCRAIRPLCLLMWAVCVLLRAGVAPAAGDPAAAPSQLSLIESHYQAGERFRAETEILRFLHDQPGHPAAPDAVLARAKLYFQEARYNTSALMAHSLLDRYPDAPVTPQAERLLGFAQVMEGRIEDGAEALARAGAPREEIVSLGALLRPPENAPDPDTAVAWSTVLPGSGFFAVGQPGKAVAAMGVNLALIAGTVIAYQQDNLGAALVLLLAELAFYSGGRQAARTAVETELARIERERRRAWVERHGGPELLGVGLTLHFGGS